MKSISKSILKCDTQVKQLSVALKLVLIKGASLFTRHSLHAVVTWLERRIGEHLRTSIQSSIALSRDKLSSTTSTRSEDLFSIRSKQTLSITIFGLTTVKCCASRIIMSLRCRKLLILRLLGISMIKTLRKFWLSKIWKRGLIHTKSICSRSSKTTNMLKNTLMKQPKSKNL